MPPKKRNKAYTKKRKGMSKGVPRTPAASASVAILVTEQPKKKMQIAEAKAMRQTKGSAKWASALAQTEDKDEAVLPLVSAAAEATEQPQKKMQLEDAPNDGHWQRLTQHWHWLR